MISAEAPAPAAGTVGFGSKALVTLAALVGLAFVILAALPYRAMLGTEESARQALEGFQFAYYPVRGWLLIHIAGGLVALLVGPVQLWLGLHDAAMDVHRKLGLVYIAAIAVGSVGGIGLALQTNGGLVFGSGLFFLAIAWIATTSLAYASIRKHLVEQHREWTIRSYVVTFAFVTFRAGQIALVGRGVPLPIAIGVMAWACWSIPLLMTEVVIQGRKIARVRI